ncbi:MAG: response regulator transcription factor [Gemmatimonadetes bacterium]|nr:response regulator transcription factor [Gemmatimonadota bacterium]
MRVLVVEDDPEVSDLLRRTISRAAGAVDLVATGADALRALRGTPYDAVVLDLGLPDMDGTEVCRRWRADGGRTPVLMLTARGALGDRVSGLDSGADDYLVKPFEVEELLARLRALLRRPDVPLPVVQRFEDVTLEPATRQVRRGDREIPLSSREFALLAFLMRAPGRVFSRAQLLEHVWDDHFDPIGNAVDVLVGRVRRKLDPDGRRPLIHTVRGAGYVLKGGTVGHGG